MGLRQEHDDEVSPDSTVEFVERRALERIPATLSASAWSPQDPTSRVDGETINVSANGCLLRLPGLAPHASLIDIQLGLPGQTVSVRARIVRREAPDLLAVEFESFADDAQAGLADFRRMLVAKTPEPVPVTRRRSFARLWLSRGRAKAPQENAPTIQEVKRLLLDMEAEGLIERVHGRRSWRITPQGRAVARGLIA